MLRLRGGRDGTELSLPLVRGLNSIGRDAANALILDLDGVSRQHATLIVGSRRIVVTDRKSKNGTFVNARRVRQAGVAVGDVIAFGPVELRLEEIEPDDTQLAVECLPEEASVDQAPSTEEDSTAIVGPPDQQAPVRVGLPELRFPASYVRGISPAMAKLEAQMAALVQGDLPVLIIGETGVGKDLLAEALHLSSPRGGEPFVPINCAAIPHDLLEAELFGIGDRVATGVAGREGKFQQAQGGTLFLDEIGEMSAELQAKLLRVLQTNRIDPLGAASVAIDVRLLAATNVDLACLMRQGRLRADLFFRIAGATLEVPPLRQRRQDIPLLVERFVHRCAQEVSKPIRGLSVRALRGLVEHDWPGNVRELEHAVRRLVYTCPPGQAIESRMLTLPHRDGDPSETAAPGAAPAVGPRQAGRWAAGPMPDPMSSLTEWPDLDLENLERRVVGEALRRTGGNQVQAAKLLGISRHRLRRRLHRWDLEIASSGGRSNDTRG